MMDPEELRAVVEAVPRGRWISYADAATAAGGTVQHARGLNARLAREKPKGAHRVLRTDGSIGATALADPEVLQRRLEREGVRFDAGGRADPARRWRPGS